MKIETQCIFPYLLFMLLNNFMLILILYTDQIVTEMEDKKRETV